MTLPELPCYPCPYNSSCCGYGVSLTDEEAATIAVEHGADKVYFTRSREWRTRVRQKRCVMFVDGACSIHAKPYYPVQCRGFPWTDGEGARYEYDITICGEFERKPDLVAIQRALPAAPAARSTR